MMIKDKIILITFIIFITGCSTGSSIKQNQTCIYKKPYHYGMINKSILFDKVKYPWFIKEYDQYNPSINELNGFDYKNINIKVFMGTWCHDSKREIPRLIKILDNLKFSESKIDIIALTKDKKGRVDITHLELVTIDGEDSRDFDDAVYAIPSKNGWKLMVAIADVSHYVKEGSQLDAESLERGNSVYFPHRVVPMLPESISNGLCSLNPEVERLCMVCEMEIDSLGSLLEYKFYSAVMLSHARLTYTEVNEMLENKKSKLRKKY